MKFAPAALVFAALALSGCQYWVTGRTEDYGAVFFGSGALDPITAHSTAQVKVDNPALTCKGGTVPTDQKPGIIGSLSKLELTCSDGRKVTGQTVVETMEGGSGHGEDDCGNKFVLVWSLDMAAMEKARDQYKEERAKRKAVPIDKCESQAGTPPHRDPL